MTHPREIDERKGRARDSKGKRVGERKKERKPVRKRDKKREKGRPVKGKKMKRQKCKTDYLTFTFFFIPIL